MAIRLSDSDINLILSAFNDSHLEELTRQVDDYPDNDPLMDDHRKEIELCEKLCNKLSFELEKRRLKRS